MTAAWKGPYGRRDLTHQFGAATMDRVNLHWDCAACRQPVDDPDFYSVGTVGYRTLDELIAYSRLGLGLAERAHRPCPACGQPATLRAADYHTYQCDPDRDFVLRWTPSAAAPSLWFWDDTGYHSTTTMLDDRFQDDLFENENLLRRAASRAESEGLEAALPDIEAAAAACDCYWEMLAFVRPLAAIGRGELARQIADEYIWCHAGLDGSDLEKARLEEARTLRDELDDALDDAPDR